MFNKATINSLWELDNFTYFICLKHFAIYLLMIQVQLYSRTYGNFTVLRLKVGDLYSFLALNQR